MAFINPHEKKPMLINPAHVRTASESGPNKGHAGHRYVAKAAAFVRMWRGTLNPCGRR
jgi:hypothetical protein